MVAIALKYLGLGYSVIPVSVTNKRPTLHSWKDYQKRKPTKSEILSWFNSKTRNMAVICGEVSDNLVVIDFDDERYFFSVQDHLLDLPIVRTKKGYHAYLRTVEKTPARNTKLAMEGKRVLAEIRADGGYAITAGSYFRGGRYQFIKGSIETVPYISAEEFDHILGEISTEDIKQSIKMTIDLKGNPYSGDGYNIKVNNRIQYVQALFDMAIKDVQNAGNGDRNNQLYRSAALLGNLAGGGYIRVQDGTVALFQAAATIGLDKEDGTRSVQQTIASGIKRGYGSPMKIEQDSLLEELGV